MKIHRVIHTLTTPGSRVFRTVISGLIFIDQVPTIVLEWRSTPDGPQPAVTIPVEPRLLRPAPSASQEFLLEDPVNDPRRWN